MIKILNVDNLVILPIPSQSRDIVNEHKHVSVVVWWLADQLEKVLSKAFQICESLYDMLGDASASEHSIWKCGTRHHQPPPPPPHTSSSGTKY